MFKQLTTFASALFSLLCFGFALPMQAQQIYMTFPDADGDGFKDPIPANVPINLNEYTFTYPGNDPIVQIGDSISFLQVFMSTECDANAANTCLPFYESSGNMYGIMGADRKYIGTVTFPDPGVYHLTGSTYGGYAFRETVEVTKCLPDTVFITEEVVVTVNLIDNSTTSTVQFELSEEITVFPNPTTGNFTINIVGDAGPDLPELKCQIFNLQGEFVQEIDGDAGYIEGGGGVYQIRLTSQGQPVKTIQLIKVE